MAVSYTHLGLAMALALGLYMLAGHCALKPLFARPRPCDLRPEMLTLVARPHGWSFPSGHTSSAFAAAFALWLQNRRLGVPALVLAGFIGFTRMYLYVHFPTDILGGVAPVSYTHLKYIERYADRVPASVAIKQAAQTVPAASASGESAELTGPYAGLMKADVYKRQDQAHRMASPCRGHGG